jgi:hypothetical protein
MDTSVYRQTFSSQDPPRCECHECVQARWKMSMEHQLASQTAPDSLAQPSALRFVPSTTVTNTAI